MAKYKKGTPEYRQYMNSKRRKQREEKMAERAIERGEHKSPKVEKATRQVDRRKAGSYLTTKGQKQRLIEQAFDYDME